MAQHGGARHTGLRERRRQRQQQREQAEQQQRGEGNAVRLHVGLLPR
jgi:hypothetical protein